MEEEEIQEWLEKHREEEEEDLAEKLAQKLGLRYFNLAFYKVNPEALKEIPEEIARNLKIIPIDKHGANLIIGAYNPTKKEVKDYLNELKNKGFNIELGVVSLKSLEKGLEEYKYIEKKKIKYLEVLEIDVEALNRIAKEISKKEDLEAYIKKYEKENPFEIINYIFGGAIKFEASDVHLEPTEDEIIVKLRIDGILYDVASFDKKLYQLIKNRIKLLGGLLLNVTTKPQDGRFSITFRGKELEVRVSTIPTQYEETIVMRILDVEKILLKLEDLGLRKEDLETLSYYIKLPNGLILSTGPTGSGKTTTQYAILNTIKRPEIKIITIEDPIEYKLEGITQTQVNPRENYTFANGLRSILRQDPDVILVGEIRDSETANIAINASLTGHLVLSTLHTNDSLGAIPRLIDLGVDNSLIPSALRLVIAQRLVRKVCNYCKEEYKPDKKLIEIIRKRLETIPENIKKDIDFENIKLVKAKGCEKCLHTGYKGRIGVFEFLKITKEMERIIYSEPTEEKILEEARKEGFVDLQQDGLIKAINKITTIDEIIRITGPLI
jgi:type IV pilus assembly protein PilB